LDPLPGSSKKPRYRTATAIVGNVIGHHDEHA
jgi:hypothetical protein